MMGWGSSGWGKLNLQEDSCRGDEEGRKKNRKKGKMGRNMSRRRLSIKSRDMKFLGLLGITRNFYIWFHRIKQYFLFSS